MAFSEKGISRSPLGRRHPTGSGRKSGSIAITVTDGGFSVRWWEQNHNLAKRKGE